MHNELVEVAVVVLTDHTKMLQSKYSTRSAYYLGMIFITWERIALLQSKFHFQIED